MKKGLKVLILISLIANLFFVSAAITLSPTTQTAEINKWESFSITVSNTYTVSEPTNSTVKEIVFTLPSGLLFINDTNSSDPGSSFSNTSNTLTWTNTTEFSVNVNSQTEFSFTANATTLGTSSITVVSTFVNLSTTTNTISVTTSDTSIPSITLNSPDNNEEDTDGVLVFDCSVTENYALSSIALYIWDNSSSEVYKKILSTAGLSNQSEFDYTFSDDGEYDWNCYANDTAGNFDWASNRTLTISSANACAPSWDCDDWDSCVDGNQTRICIDSNSCGSNSTKPDEIQACEDECVSEWDCTDWAPLECPETEKQTRTCIDSNECSSASGKPSETRACTFESGTSWIFISVVLGLVALGVIGGAVFYFRSKPQDNYNMSNPTTQNYTGNNYGEVSGNSQGYTYKYS